jgi:hypothetical protein
MQEYKRRIIADHAVRYARSSKHASDAPPGLARHGWNASAGYWLDQVVGCSIRQQLANHEACNVAAFYRRKYL